MRNKQLFRGYLAVSAGLVFCTLSLTAATVTPCTVLPSPAVFAPWASGTNRSRQVRRGRTGLLSD